ncbi:MAG TPA: HD domain-containing protein [Planktothrix sp.]|jgi:guanosine-3',5'-bis(diphosphate) 3'-pyrophosphohydrolase
MNEQKDMQLLFRALKFASIKHTKQRRKGSSDIPYINHPIEVATILSTVGSVQDASTLAAAILHDTVEDTDTTPEEIENEFGSDIRKIVMECTDDKTLGKQDRKRAQIETAPHKSGQAKLVKMADKISNVSAMASLPPSDWSLDRRGEYLDWTEKVVHGLRGHCNALDELYDESLNKARERLKADRGQ